ncbi:MAG: PepSY domain-containing protein [Thiomonas sp.]
MRFSPSSGLLHSVVAAVSGLLLSAVATVAQAGPTCTDKPQSAWLDAAKFQTDLKAKGYALDKFKTTKGNCYEIYGKDAAGKKVEIYFNPVDGKVVKEERH